MISYRHPDGLAGTFDLEDYEKKLLARGDFKPKKIDDPALLPHLNIHVRDGRLLRAYEPTGKLANLFDPRATWLFERAPKRAKPEAEAGKPDADKPDKPEKPDVAPASKEPRKDKNGGMPCKITTPPRLFVIETGYVFVVLGIKPTTPTLTSFQDLYAAVVRRGMTHLLPENMPRKKAGKEGEMKPHPLVAMGEEGAIEDTTIRHWLKLFIPEVMLDAPIGSWPNPMSVNVLYTEGLPDAAARHRLRLAHGSDQPIDPSASDCRIEGHPAMWEPSARELCVFSPVGVTWMIWPIDAKGLLSQFESTMLERYIYKWVLIEHERLFLLELSSSCASMSNRPDGRIFGRLRLALLQYTAKFSFGHISSEERHDRFYCGLRNALDVGGLFEEVKGEITEIDEYLSDKRADLLNQVLAFLTLVLTPVGLVIGIFERDTLPSFNFAWHDLVGSEAWATWSKLLFHVPLWLTVLSAVIGFVLFTRLLGMNTVRGLVQRIKNPGADD
ncbi:hypothetical protein [Polyangium sp. 6x1]|uniref:hypothetical protein n=1 Tax=Polyangium sp. 6x1 TaxID=3042689 RepID=UPI002482A23B|nr:hypothetical protein [Polyangium sp. 6x1]MDI1445330.1 hypothetical protein [Polyangium sp. 6x1]